MKKSLWGIPAILIFLIVIIWCCSPSPSTKHNPPPQPSGSFEISPAADTIRTGGTIDFQVTDSGTVLTDISYAIAESTFGGTVSDSGHYTAPGWGGIYHVIATSNSDSTLTDTANVLVTETWECGDNPTVPEYEFDHAFLIDIMPPQYGTEHSTGIEIIGNDIYISGEDHHYVAKYTTDGNCMGWYGRGRWPVPFPGTDSEGTTGWHEPGGAGGWPADGTGPDQYRYPHGITANTNGTVYVSDWGNMRIQSVAGGNWSTGEEDGVPVRVRYIAIGPDGYIYGCTDQQNTTHRVFKYAQFGTIIDAWGTAGTGDGQFSLASCIAVDKNCNVFVTDSYLYRVQKFDSTGNYLGGWGEYGTDSCQFRGPGGIAVDDYGFVYINDGGSLKVKKFTGDGRFVTSFSIADHIISPGTGMNDIVVDKDGKIYVTMQNSAQVIVFRPIAK
jgi:hypothetical protein